MRSTFMLGNVVITPAALDLIQEDGQLPESFVSRHANSEGLGTATRLLSAHKTRTGRWVWVLTEADRSMTVILLPTECRAVLRRRPANFAKG